MNYTVLDREELALAGREQRTEAGRAEVSSGWEALLLRIARRADELVRLGEGSAHRVPDRWFWMKAEREVLGTGSLVAAFDLLQLCARLSRSRSA